MRVLAQLSFGANGAVFALQDDVAQLAPAVGEVAVLLVRAVALPHPVSAHGHAVAAVIRRVR